MELLVERRVPLERFRLSSMRKAKNVQVRYYLKLVEIQLSQVFKSLDALSIELRESFGRLLYVGEAGHDNNDSSNEH